MKTIITIIMGIFLLTTISALYGGETAIVEFEFNPVACSVTDNLTSTINQSIVSVDIPSNFVGNLTITCFSGEEANPVIQYISNGGGGRRTVYKNVTEYKDRDITKYVDKIVEVPGDSKIIEKIIESTGKRTGSVLAVLLLLLVIFSMLIYMYKLKVIKEETLDDEYNDYYEKGGENEDE